MHQTPLLDGLIARTIWDRLQGTSTQCYSCIDATVCKKTFWRHVP